MKKPTIDILEIDSPIDRFYFKTYSCLTPENYLIFEKQLKTLKPALEIVEGYPYHTAGYGGGIMSVMVKLVDKTITKEEYHRFRKDPNYWFNDNLVHLDLSAIIILD